MPVARRSRAFTLIEAMIVVVIVGVLAVLAAVAYHKWILSSYLGEAQDMLNNIRSAEETFKAENGGYLNVSTSLDTNGTDTSGLYPSTHPMGNFSTGWGGPCGVCSGGSWAALNVNPSGPVRFGYAVVAGATGSAPPDIPVNGAKQNTAAMSLGGPWFIAEAVCDVDSDGKSPDTMIFATSANNELLFNNEGQ
jgi:prepilin-type N-terminal cleavage/methylation domain-containing protein